MCRLLYIRSKENFSPEQHLRLFAENCRNSKEYQGHGWGLSLWRNGEWQHYRNIKPVWEDDLTQFEDTSQVVVHARSAFRDQDICVENNMPFVRDGMVFAFNGELQGVRIKEQGRIGAEKIFNFIMRFFKDDLREALERGVVNIRKRSKYIRAMNIIITDGERAYVSTEFGEDAEYFTMHYRREDRAIFICSEPLSEPDQWKQITNQTIGVF